MAVMVNENLRRIYSRAMSLSICDDEKEMARELEAIFEDLIIEIDIHLMGA